MDKINNHFEKAIWKALEDVKDPEIPVISVVDLGIINDIEIADDNFITISMTPTFTACPANEFMQAEIKKRIEKVGGVTGTKVIVDFSVPWNTNRITEKGRKQLKEFGLAPPPKHNGEI